MRSFGISIKKNVRILRQEHARIQVRGETLNLIGVDDSLSRSGVVKPLMMPDTVNILLSHDPNNFDRAARLGIDLTLAGHTHGGQLSLEFLRRGLCLSRFETPYVSGWYKKPGGQQLYVNRGIGTTGFPIRLGARPEITVLELSRVLTSGDKQAGRGNSTREVLGGCRQTGSNPVTSLFARDMGAIPKDSSVPTALSPIMCGPQCGLGWMFCFH